MALISSSSNFSSRLHIQGIIYHIKRPVHKLKHTGLCKYSVFNDYSLLSSSFLLSPVISDTAESALLEIFSMLDWSLSMFGLMSAWKFEIIDLTSSPRVEKTSLDSCFVLRKEFLISSPSILSWSICDFKSFEPVFNDCCNSFPDLGAFKKEISIPPVTPTANPTPIFLSFIHSHPYLKSYTRININLFT